MYNVVQKNCLPGFYKISRLGDGFIQNRKKQHKAHIEGFPTTLVVTFRDFMKRHAQFSLNFVEKKFQLHLAIIGQVSQSSSLHTENNLSYLEN